MNKDDRSTVPVETIRMAALAADQIQARMALSKFTAATFTEVGNALYLIGHVIGSDRNDSLSPFGHGNDETVGVSILLRIASELISGAADLIESGRTYAGSALIRQLVELEYLAWAFDAKGAEAARWLRSTQSERKTFFSPAKLRAASGDKFRGVDYSYHCEMGGHPVPRSWVLLEDEGVIAQLMISDSLGHTGRTWDHLVDWANRHSQGGPILAKAREMLDQYQRWKKIDQLTTLPAPPATFPKGW